jgi:hypothetical protein
MPPTQRSPAPVLPSAMTAATIGTNTTSTPKADPKRADRSGLHRRSGKQRDHLSV